MLDAEKVEPQDPDLAANLKKLDQLVIAAQTPVQVTIGQPDRCDDVQGGSFRSLRNP